MDSLRYRSDVLFGLSRQLERELSAVTAEREEYRKYWLDEQKNRDKWIECLSEVTAERDVLRADLCTFAVDMEKQLSAVTAERDSLSAIVQSSYQLLQSIADEDDAGHFQINHNLRRRLDALCHEIKTTT